MSTDTRPGVVFLEPHMKWTNIHKLTLITALAFSTSRTQRALIMLFILVIECYHYTLLLDERRHKGFVDHFAATTITGALLMSIDWLVLTRDPQSDVVYTRSAASPRGRVGTKDSPIQVKDFLTSLKTESAASASPSALRRLAWAIGLSLSNRGFGTTAQIPGIISVSPSLASSRSRFCIYRLGYGVWELCRLVASYNLLARSPYFRELILAGDPSPVGRAANVVFTLHGVYCMLNGAHYVVSALAVAGGISSPQDWPDMFGRLSDAYTLRNAWGKSWHQIFRKPFSSIGAWTAQSLFRVHPNSLPSRYIKLYTAFLLSAWLHVAGDFVLHQNTLPVGAPVIAHYAWDACFSPQFLIPQALAITLEDAVIAFVKCRAKSPSNSPQNGSSTRPSGSKEARAEVAAPKTLESLGRLVGYAWVFIWFCYTIPPYTRGALGWDFKQ